MRGNALGYFMVSSESGFTTPVAVLHRAVNLLTSVRFIDVNKMGRLKFGEVVEINFS